MVYEDVLFLHADRPRRELNSHEVLLKVVLQKPIPTQIRHLILHITNCKKEVDGFWGAVDFPKTT
jgi:hypothetical protein